MDKSMSIPQLRLKSEEIRKRLMEVVYKAKAGHIGGDLSSLNVLTALYMRVMNVDAANPKMDGRDRFIMSKGHCVEALYCVLEAKGFITKELVDTYGDYLSVLAGHPTIEVPGIEFNSGALGHGLSIGVGCAIAAKMDKKPFRTYVLMGDGEQGEGSIYEAAMAGSNYKLDNLVAMIDRNGLQISDTTENVMKLDSINERWTASDGMCTKLTATTWKPSSTVWKTSTTATASPILWCCTPPRDSMCLTWKMCSNGTTACHRPMNMNRPSLR